VFANKLSVPIAFLLTFTAHAPGLLAQTDATVHQVFVPPGVAKPPRLEQRRQSQLAGAHAIGAFHDFKFTDRLEESGITFRGRIVEDAAKTYKAVHYDHGTGLAVADVDGDGLVDIYFVNQVGNGELWRNIGGGKFENATASSGITTTDRIGVSASFADLDNDGDADLYVTTVRKGNLLFENDGRGRFTDISAKSGTDFKAHSSGAVFFDYDRDGLLDLLLANVGQYTSELIRRGENDGQPYTFFDGYSDAFSGHLFPERSETSVLFRNTGKLRFEKMPEDVFPVDASWSGDAAAVDINDDGWLDIYLLNMQGHDQYFENAGGKRFVDRTRDVFPKTSWGSMGVKAFDWNNDGRVDLFITDMHSDMSQVMPPEKEKLKSTITWSEHHMQSGGMSIYGNSFFQNRGDGGFDEISDRIGAENFWPWGLSTGDLNADGFQDAFVTASMNYPFRYGVNNLLLNEAGTRFLDAEFVLGVEPRRGGVTAQPWFPLDCSGVDVGHKECQGQTGPIEVWAARGSRASAILDLDDDGDLDIVTNEFNAAPQVLVSDLAQVRKDLRWVKIQLKGKSSNRSGIGSRVTVKTAKGNQVQWQDGKSGYLSQSVYPLYFGLGDAESIEAIEVRWPSGKVQTWDKPVKLNALVTIPES